MDERVCVFYFAANERYRAELLVWQTIGQKIRVAVESFRVDHSSSQKLPGTCFKIDINYD